MRFKRKIISKKFRTPQLLRCSILYLLWRKKVFIRDGYVCKMCGRKSQRLNAHHIYSYAKFPALRLEVKNGITLCSSCHWKFHLKYGKDMFPDIRILIKLGKRLK